MKVSFPLNLPCVCLSPVDKKNGIVRYTLHIDVDVSWVTDVAYDSILHLFLYLGNLCLEVIYLIPS